MDYRVRGFTRDVNGKKIYIDHRMQAISHYIEAALRNRYNIVDVNMYQENIFHCKMMLKDFDLDDYLFDQTRADLSAGEAQKIRRQLRQEMTEIYYGRNLPAIKGV